MTIAPGITVPADKLEEICRRYEIKELMLFGSTVRGEARPDSDVNLLVEFLPGSKRGLIRYLAAQRELSELLDRKVDLVSKRSLRTELRDSVLSEAKSVYAA
jgi:predicted nucleotidyltransferase